MELHQSLKKRYCICQRYCICAHWKDDIPFLYHCIQLLHSKCITLCLPLLSFTRFLPVHFSSLSKSLCITALHSYIEWSPKFGVTSLECTCPILHNIYKHRFGPIINPRGKTLLTGHQLDFAPADYYPLSLIVSQLLSMPPEIPSQKAMRLLKHNL